MLDLEERTEETRTLPDGSELKLEIYPLKIPSGLGGARKGIVEKVLRAELPVFNQKPIVRASSPRGSWGISEETYLGLFRNATGYRQILEIITRINKGNYN